MIDSDVQFISIQLEIDLKLYHMLGLWSLLDLPFGNIIRSDIVRAQKKAMKTKATNE